jgi:hypothetical protein
VNHTTLADEDFAIRRDRLPSELDAVIAECDAADYRAMLAREQRRTDLAPWPPRRDAEIACAVAGWPIVTD